MNPLERSTDRPRRPLAALLLAIAVAACSPVTYTQDFDRGATIPPTGTWALVRPSPEDAEALADISPFLQRRIERAVERELADAGYTRADRDPPDVLVAAYPILPRPGEGRSFAAPPPRSSVSVAVGVGFGSPYGYWGRPYGAWGRPYSGWGRPYGWGWPAAWSFRASSPWGLPYFGYPGYGWIPGFGYTVYAAGGGPRPGVVGAGERGYGSLVIDVVDPETGTVVWEGVAVGALLDMPAGEDQDAYIDDVVQRTLAKFPP